MSSKDIEQIFSGSPEDGLASLARNLWEETPPAADLDLLAQKAGDAARDESWRIPLGESGMLDFFCGLINTDGIRSTLIAHSLRVIGNSCADKDENRERVVASGCLPKIVTLLNQDSLLAFVVPVLFNICVDYEPAQVAVYKAGINPELVSLISTPRVAEAAPLMGYICKLLGFVATQEPEANLVHPATPFVLLSLATNPQSAADIEDFLGLASVALTYLSQQQFQQSFLETPNACSLFLDAFSKACDSLDVSEIEPEDQAQLKQVQTAFTSTLADLSAHPLFASSCPLDGPEAKTLQRWVSTPHISLQSAACLALGNIARSDDTCTFLVQKSAIHGPLIAVLAEPSNTDANLLHSVLGFLKNMAIPISNKAVLGDGGLFESHIVPRIWDLDTQPQVQFDAVSLTRLLLVNCPANVQRICSPQSADTASPTHDRTKLHLLMDLHKRSDQEPTKMETARAVVTVCRVLHASASTDLPLPPRSVATASTSPSAEPRTRLQEFYDTHPDLTDTMLYLCSQTKFPVLRSELLFVFALMARTAEGASVVARSMQHDSIVGLLVEAVTGEKVVSDEGGGGSPEGSVSDINMDMQRLGLGELEARAPQQPQPSPVSGPNVDRENGLVLITELLRRCPDELASLPKQTFQRILRQGGEQLLHERNAADGQGEDAAVVLAGRG
ncbi:Uu.00g121320.m01.CDS01 [Anthostomella pinea]|uniref:Uu.00g121320.m01.CDS01 n=1 Tax=Anthostomella pinea TaxID=933095 RepID=A0AAI8YEW3_9PEZI|nr:Uu.00g121320.m01.CDS01 [Anthostomella pinea]